MDYEENLTLWDFFSPFKEPYDTVSRIFIGFIIMFYYPIFVLILVLYQLFKYNFIKDNSILNKIFFIDVKKLYRMHSIIEYILGCILAIIIKLFI